MHGERSVRVVPDRSPTAEIVLPTAESALCDVLPTALIASALDLEDGILTGEALEWSLDNDPVPIATGLEAVVSLEQGEHTVRLTATDSSGHSAADEVTFVVGPDCATGDGEDGGPARLVRGECNNDGEIDISDVVCILKWLFVGEPEPGCVAAANVDGTGGVEVTDAVDLLMYLFLDGAAPAAPFPDCGPATSPADAELSCAHSAGCP